MGRDYRTLADCCFRQIDTHTHTTKSCVQVEATHLHRGEEGSLIKENTRTDCTSGTEYESNYPNIKTHTHTHLEVRRQVQESKMCSRTQNTKRNAWCGWSGW